MPRTIGEGFQDFHEKLKTSAVESALAKSHRASIEACLLNNFGLRRFSRIGSFGNGTNVSGHSDVDYLACLPKAAITATSTSTLVKVRNALEARFPRTGVRISTPAIVCPFGVYKSEDTEIVVADYVREDSGFKVYAIADGLGSWMEASPDAHNHYVSAVDAKHNGKVKPLIRFIKAWRCYRHVPISSFYLEMRVAKYANSESAIIYDIDVKRLLAMLRDNNLAALQDPTGVSGYIYPCKTEALKADALSKLRTAASRAEKAQEAESSGDTKASFAWWRLLYDDNFPTYYYT